MQRAAAAERGRVGAAMGVPWSCRRDEEERAAMRERERERERERSGERKKKRSRREMRETAEKKKKIYYVMNVHDMD